MPALGQCPVEEGLRLDLLVATGHGPGQSAEQRFDGGRQPNEGQNDARRDDDDQTENARRGSSASEGFSGGCQESDDRQRDDHAVARFEHLPVVSLRHPVREEDPASEEHQSDGDDGQHDASVPLQRVEAISSGRPQHG